MGDEEMHLIARLVVEIDKSGQVGAVLKVERDISAIIKGVLQRVPAGRRIAALQGGALDRAGLMRRQGVLVGLGRESQDKGYAP